MGEEKTGTDVARASEVGNNLLEEPVESVKHKEQESVTKKENYENVGIEETIEAKISNQTEDSVGKECSSKKLLVEENEQTAAVPREDAEMVVETTDTEEPIEGETKEVVELEGEKNDPMEQDPKEHETTEVVKLEGEKNEGIEQDNEPQEVVVLEFAGQDSKITLTLGKDNEVKESDASERISEPAVEDEAPKKEMLGGINLETKEAGDDGQVKAAREVNEAEMEDKHKVKEDQENQVDINKEKMEVELEPTADKSDNESIRAEINLEEKGLDVKNGSETAQVERKLEGSSNEEDKQDNAKGSKKRKRKENAVDKTKGGNKDEESQTPAISVSTRPVRERKSVERLVASVEKEVIREIFVEKGPGVALNDIPNVAYKLSKKANDEIFKQLHTILFGRRGKAIQMKNHLSQFSGFVWHDNEEKNKMKMREKLDKLVKEKLIEFCDVLDIPITNKVSTKKEDVVTKIMEFLASPHSTTDELLSEKEHSEKTTKRKRSVGPGSPTSGSAKSSRKRKRTSEKREGDKGESDKEDEALTENQGNGNGNLNQSEEESSEKKSSESEDAMDEDTTHPKKRFKKAPVKVSVKRTKKSDLSESEEEKKGSAKSRRQSLNKSSDKAQSSKQVKDVPEKEPNNKTKNVDAKGRPKEEKLKPNDKVLRNQICQILKEVDFNTATFTDILKLLGKHFKTDLTPRKASIKLIIQEELTKIADAADDEEEEEEEEQNVTPEPAKVKA